MIFLTFPLTKLQYMKRDPAANDGTPDLGDQYKDERTEKKIHEHLNNEKDVITEEDIANAQVGPLLKDDEAPAAEMPPAKESPAADKENLKDNTEPGIDTSWNVLES